MWTKRGVAAILIFTVSLFAIEPNFKGYDGTAVVYTPSLARQTLFNTNRAHERLNPCSTFKILNSIISLHSGAVRDENEIIVWDGKRREYEFWNKDHNMRSAISVSTVWFYQELAKRVGGERMQKGVESAGYGNMDTSSDLTSFWLGGGSLKISAIEQVDFLSKLVDERLPFPKALQQRTKEIIKQSDATKYELYGKTGTCSGAGWFVGFVDFMGEKVIFAFNIKGKGASGVEAKKIAVEYLNKAMASIADSATKSRVVMHKDIFDL